MMYHSLWFCLLFLVNYLQATPFAYVANPGDGTVSVIDIATSKVIKTIALTGSNPFPIFPAITPDNKIVYVTCLSGNVQQIDVATNTVVGTPIPVPTAGGIAITPDGKKIYVGQTGNNKVSVIDRATNTVTNVITVGTKPNFIAVTPNGKFVYVANGVSNTVSKIDTIRDTVVATIPLNPLTLLSPTGVAITPDNKTVYVTLSDSANVIPIDVDSNALGKPISVGGSPQTIAITHDGTTAFVANASDDTVSRINLALNKVQGSPIPVGSVPFGTAITTDDARVYVTNQASSSVTPILIASHERLVAIGVGSNPLGIAITPPPMPPSNVASTIRSNIFLNRTELVLVTSWDASLTENVVAYAIYFNGTLVATIPASNTLQFITCVNSITQAQQFSIASVDSDGIQSVLVPLVL